MKKALIIAYNDLNNSGVPNVIYQTVRALHNEYDFDILVFEEDEYYFEKFQKEGIKVNLIKYKAEKPNGKIARLFWWFHKMPKQHYLFMKQLLKENNYLVIHSFKEYYSWPFFKAAKEAGITTRILHRNINRECPRQLSIKLLQKKNRRLSLKYASRLVGVSDLCCKNAFGNRKYVVLYDCYDEQKYNLNVKNKLGNNDLVLTHVASINENKNQLFSAMILKGLLMLHKNTRLNIVGADGLSSYYEKVIEYIKCNDLDKNVSVIEKNDCVEKIFEKTTFAILPSFNEGLSLTTLEAQACGIMVFASSNLTKEVDCGCVKFLSLDDGPKKWAECIFEFFITNKNKRFDRNVEKFSFDSFKDNLKTLYDDVLIK